MAQATAIRLTGDDLRIEDVWAVGLGDADAALSDEARTKMRAARELVERAAHGTHEHTYGINTGFGRFVSKSIPEEQTEELQLRLLRSHACGVGDPYPDEIVRAAMLLRANALAKGNSGARIETVELLLECLVRGVLPRVPSRGSGLGAARRAQGTRARARPSRCARPNFLSPERSRAAASRRERSRPDTDLRPRRHGCAATAAAAPRFAPRESTSRQTVRSRC